MESFEVRLNGEWTTARKFNKGEKVKNPYGDMGTVIDTENGGLFVNVDWDVNDTAGKTWLATSLTVA